MHNKIKNKDLWYMSCSIGVVEQSDVYEVVPLRRYQRANEPLIPNYYVLFMKYFDIFIPFHINS